VARHVIALISDAAFLPAGFATARSILDCGLDDDIQLALVLQPDCLANDVRAWLQSAHPRIELVAADAGKFLPDALASWRSVLTPIFLRDALPEIFPEADRILYVDCDVLATSAVGEAFTLDMEGKAVAAADNDLVSEMVGVTASWVAYREALGVPLGIPYLNAGILLMDARAWREQDLKQKIIATYFANKERCRYFDQCPTNLFLKGDFARLSPAWNFQPSYQAIGAEDIVKPKLVHFAGSAKPWRNDGFVFRRDYRERYRTILAGTPFESFFQPCTSLSGKQIKEAWRSLKRTLRGREIQTGLKRTQIEALRTKLAALLASGVFAG